MNPLKKTAEGKYTPDTKSSAGGEKKRQYTEKRGTAKGEKKTEELRGGKNIMHERLAVGEETTNLGRRQGGTQSSRVEGKTAKRDRGKNRVRSKKNTASGSLRSQVLGKRGGQKTDGGKSHLTGI